MKEFFCFIEEFNCLLKVSVILLVVHSTQLWAARGWGVFRFAEVRLGTGSDGVFVRTVT